MKLKDLIEAIEHELAATPLGEQQAKVSLAFTARKSGDGEPECDFVVTSSLSRAKLEELHRLDLVLDVGRSGTAGAPRHQIAEDFTPRPAGHSDLDRPQPEPGDLDQDDPDTPAYFRRLFPQS